MIFSEPEGQYVAHSPPRQRAAPWTDARQRELADG